VASYCKHTNERSGSMKYGEFLDEQLASQEGLPGDLLS
jgi:hypothetical protein